MYSIVEDKIEYTELLLRYGADVNYVNNNGTALHYAVANDNIEIVKLILKYFPDVYILDEEDETALELAERYGDDNIIKLIEDYEDNPQRIAATRIQSQARRRRTFKKLQTDLIKEQSRILGERMPDSEFMEPYISPIRDRRDLIRILARDRGQRTARENFRTERFLKELNQYGGMFDNLPIDILDEQLKNMNCKDRLYYCQTNRKSRDHCNSKQTFKKYIEPCRKKSKMNKTKRRAIEVSKRLQKKNLLETKIKSMQDEMRRREEMEERELLERLRQPREIELRRNIDEDFEFDDDLNGFPPHY
jgi:hypothetical protein